MISFSTCVAAINRGHFWSGCRIRLSVLHRRRLCVLNGSWLLWVLSKCGCGSGQQQRWSATIRLWRGE